MKRITNWDYAFALVEEGSSWTLYKVEGTPLIERLEQQFAGGKPGVIFSKSRYHEIPRKIKERIKFLKGNKL